MGTETNKSEGPNICPVCNGEGRTSRGNICKTCKGKGILILKPPDEKKK